MDNLAAETKNQIALNFAGQYSYNRALLIVKSTIAAGSRMVRLAVKTMVSRFVAMVEYLYRPSGIHVSALASANIINTQPDC